jgi:transposase, IS6 family
VLLNKNASSSPNPTNTPVGSNVTSGSSLPQINNDGPTNFAGANATQIASVTQKGPGVGLSANATRAAGIVGTITGKSNTAVYGLASNTSKGSNAAGVTGPANTETGSGVAGYTSSPKGTGVLGIANATNGGTGVSGISSATSGSASGVSLRDIEELLEERGLNVYHTTIWRWVQYYGPELDQRLRRHLKPTNKSWRVDETYVRVKGRRCYLYQAIDSKGVTIDFLLSAFRDADVAKRPAGRATSRAGNTSHRCPGRASAFSAATAFLAPSIQNPVTGNGASPQKRDRTIRKLAAVSLIQWPL